MADATQIGWRKDTVALSIGLLAFCLHALFAARYDLFRDELYFIVCGRHPALGYADQPPGVPLMAAGLYTLGQSVWLMRLPTALAAGALAWLAARFARLLGGDGIAAAGAALSVTLAPMLMGMGATLNTTAFDPLAWTAIAWGLVYTVKTGDRRTLWLCGVVAGIDLEFKYALVFWGLSLFVGLVLTGERRVLARKALWQGIAAAALIAAPSLAWQALHGFPFLELAAAARDKNTDTPPLVFVLNQVVVMSPVLAPLWLAGVAAPFLIPQLRPARFLALAFLTCAALVMLTHGKDYYLAAAYPVMFIIGAVAVAHGARSTASRWALSGWAVMTVAFSAWIAPMVLPVLPVPALKTYIQHFPLQPQQQERSFRGTLLPQLFADQLGWRDYTRELGEAWARIPPADRVRTGIKVDNYGEAAALDIYGPSLGLPPALSGHNQYYLWGLRGQHPVNLLVVQEHPERLAPYCQRTMVLGVTASPDAMAYENGKAIAFCQGLKVDLQALWPQMKHYY